MYYADWNANAQDLDNLTSFVQSNPGAGLLSRWCSGLTHGYEGDPMTALALKDINVQHILAGHSYHEKVTLYSGAQNLSLSNDLAMSQC